MAAATFDEIPGLNMAELRLQGFKVHALPAYVDVPAVHGRRDFYKMGLITGEMTIGYGDEVLELRDTVLFFVNPRVPRSLLRRSQSTTTGYACIFTEAFMPAIVKKSPLFNAGQNPLIRLDSEQSTFMTSIFQKMLAVRDGDYAYKSDLIKNCIELIIHEALSIQPTAQQPVNGAARMTHLFTDLLERQFPIEHTAEPLRLRTAQDFAAKLAVHINYLNRAVKRLPASRPRYISQNASRRRPKLCCSIPTGAWRISLMRSVLGTRLILITFSNGSPVLRRKLCARFDNHTYWFDYRLNRAAFCLTFGS
jgi:AraC family transcriptional activator of pobA